MRFNIQQQNQEHHKANLTEYGEKLYRNICKIIGNSNTNNLNKLYIKKYCRHQQTNEINIMNTVRKKYKTSSVV